MADALLDDLDDLSDIEPQDNAQDSSNEDSDVPDDDDEAETDRKQRPRLLDDPSLKAHLASISTSSLLQDSKPSSSSNDSTQKDAEYAEHQLILSSNKHLIALSQEIHRTHLTLCKLYHPKFPELEELLTDPYQYRSAVEIIGNEMDVTIVNDRLNEVLTSNQIITISVAGSTTNGRPLTKDEMDAVHTNCLYLDELKETQEKLTSFVESRMEQWAPNICALIGSSLAAKLLASTGGLAELSKIPACNLQLLGKVKMTSASRGGLATNTSKQHAGYLTECELVSGMPNYLKMRAVKAVAGKLALAARTDHVNVESGRRRTDEVGRRFYEELRGKFVKWEEPDKAQVVKALPKPDLTTKKRRGGRRIRRLKERFEETEMMKQANKRAFSVEAGEYGDDAMGLTLGMLSSKEGGAMRNTVEKKKMRQANTKASRKRAIQMSSGASNGLASSMVFTPVQGLELVNPDAQKEKVREANNKWFQHTAGFQSALPKK
ncbi:hypothetical protein ACHAWO_002514 [Cyclotella atomus]|uniref:Nop domain-containing protein n=1 Tax=Cyclotella atomus TaxID=382360 RepID=A0ABD3N938_9STRA